MSYIIESLLWENTVPRKQEIWENGLSVGAVNCKRKCVNPLASPAFLHLLVIKCDLTFMEVWSRDEDIVLKLISEPQHHLTMLLNQSNASLLLCILMVQNKASKKKTFNLYQDLPWVNYSCYDLITWFSSRGPALNTRRKSVLCVNLE